ncbi:MAG: VOC family protein [Propionibacteriaceae bacterium]
MTSIAMTTIDCAEVETESRFWAELLGLEVVATDGENYAMLRGPDGPALGIGKVEGYRAPGWPDEHGKQFHLDLAVEDLDEAERRCLELGATKADPQPGETWRVMIDPAGHPFCLTDAKNWA